MSLICILGLPLLSRAKKRNADGATSLKEFSKRPRRIVDLRTSVRCFAAFETYHPGRIFNFMDCIGGMIATRPCNDPWKVVHKPKSQFMSLCREVAPLLFCNSIVPVCCSESVLSVLTITNSFQFKRRPMGAATSRQKG